MDIHELLNRIQAELVSDIPELANEELTLACRMDQTSWWNSMNHMHVMHVLHEKFHVPLTLENIARLTNFKAIISEIVAIKDQS